MSDVEETYLCRTQKPVATAFHQSDEGFGAQLLVDPPEPLAYLASRRKGEWVIRVK